MQAWTKLLTGTRRVWSKTPNTRVHIKMGDATTALKEFKSLRPKHVHDFKNPDGVRCFYMTYFGIKKVHRTMKLNDRLSYLFADLVFKSTDFCS